MSKTTASYGAVMSPLCVIQERLVARGAHSILDFEWLAGGNAVLPEGYGSDQVVRMDGAHPAGAEARLPAPEPGLPHHWRERSSAADGPTEKSTAGPVAGWSHMPGGRSE